jgi:hypothetical protein
MILWALATLFGGSSSSSSSSGSIITVAVNGFAAAAARQLGTDEVDFDKLGSQGVANSLWGAVKLGQQPEGLLEKSVEWLSGNAGRCKMQVGPVTSCAAHTPGVRGSSLRRGVQWALFFIR